MLSSVNKYKITYDGNAPKYRVELPDCVSYEEVSFENGILCLKFIFPDQECYDENKTATLYVLSGGCEKPFDIEINNPCEGFELVGDGIKLVDGLRFFADATNVPAMPYEYIWDYNPAVLKIVDRNDKFVSFEFVSTGVSPINIGVKIVNANGCCLVAEKTFDICFPVAKDLDTQTICEEGKIVAYLQLEVEECDSTCGGAAKIDWSTVEVSLPKRVTYEKISDGYIKLLFPSDYPKSILSVKYCVCDVQNRKTCASICVNVVPCSGKLFASDITGELGCTDCSETQEALSRFAATEETQVCTGGSVKFDIATYINSEKPLDFTSFTFVPTPSDIFISATEMKTPNGNAVFGSDRMICYTPITYGALEVINYSIKDIDGTIAYGLVKIYRTASCEGNPSLVTTNNDSICIESGNCLLFNPLMNDDGDYDPSTLVIETIPPSTGTIDKNSDGSLNICIDPNYEGIVELEYYVKDINGIDSNVSILEIIAIKSFVTTPKQFSFCNSDAAEINLFDLLGILNTNGEWTLVNTTASFSVNNVFRKYFQNEVIGNGHIVTIDFSNSPSGIYEFEYGNKFGSCGGVYSLMVEILEPVELPEDVEASACVMHGEIKLSSFAVLSGGSWNNIQPGGLGEVVNTNTLGEGVYIWEYRVQNQGTYGQVCDSIFKVTLTIDDVAYTGKKGCVTVCSQGHEQQINECEDPPIYESQCQICLFDYLRTDGTNDITIGGVWYLTDAPQEVHNWIDIDGKLYLTNVNDKLKTDYNGCIDLGRADCGEYTFTYRAGVQGSGCYSETQVKVTVLPEPIEIPKKEIRYCNSIGILNLWEEINCIGLIKNGTYELIEGQAAPFNFSGNCTDILDPSLIDFTENNEQTFVLKYKAYSIIPIGCEVCEACENCAQIVDICIVIVKDESSGVANNATAPIGECSINLNSLLTGAVSGGQWTYIGCNELSDTEIDQNCDLSIGGYSKDQKVFGNVVKANGVPGYYFFRYETNRPNGCCSETVVVLQLVEVGNSGTGSEQVLGEACVDLNSFLTGQDTGGVWFTNNQMIADTPCVNISSPSGLHSSGKLNTTGFASGDYFYYYVVPIGTVSYRLLFNSCWNASTIKITI